MLTVACFQVILTYIYKKWDFRQYKIQDSSVIIFKFQRRSLPAPNLQTKIAN